MPRNHEYTNTNEKLKRIKLAREQLQLEQERAAWAKACRPDYPGTSNWQLRQNKYYIEQLKDLNNVKYHTLLYDLRCLIVAQKKRRRAAELRAEACEASFDSEETPADT